MDDYPEEFNSLRETGEYAKVTREAIKQAITRGDLKAVKKGRRWHIKREDVDYYRSHRYDREARRRNAAGELVFDLEKGFVSVLHAAKFVAMALDRPTTVNDIYYRIRLGVIPAFKERAAWVIRKEDLLSYIYKEIEQKQTDRASNEIG